MIRSYRDLEIWQKSIDLTVEIYRLTRGFPVHERFGLSVQLRRAAVSIGSNIAEGRSRLTRGDFRRGVSIARGSIAELETQLEIAKRLGYVSGKCYATLTRQVESVGQMASGLLRRLSQAPKPEARGPNP
jgi:four helix bundle protein